MFFEEAIISILADKEYPYTMYFENSGFNLLVEDEVEATLKGSSVFTDMPKKKQQ